jgi:hypothetical protein
MKLKMLHGHNPGELQSAFDHWASKEHFSVVNMSLNVRQQADKERPLIYELALIYAPIEAPDLGEVTSIR